MPLARYTTAGTILNKTAKKLGLIEVDITDPVASTNPDIVRLKELLDEVGQELAESYEWRHLLVEQTITGDGVTDTYALADDFLDMVPQSQWNRTSDYPLAGPISVQLWQYRKAFATNPIYAEFRQDTNVVRFIPAIANLQVVAWEYKSRAWVRPAASGLGTGTSKGQTLGVAGSDEVALSGDFVLFDPLLMRRALALRFREDSGFETAQDQAAYQRSLDMALGRAEGGAPVLSLSSRRARSRRFIGSSNVPDGNW